MFRPILTLTAVWAFAPLAPAAWITIRNDTTEPIVLKETILRDKPVRILPGETLREFQSSSGEKKLRFYDETNPAKPVLEEKILWNVVDVNFRFVKDGLKYKLISVKP